MRTLYKILFEVKVLHEFYLTDPQGSSVFDLAAQPDRLQFLLSRFAADVASVNEDLQFCLSDEQKALFRNYHMVLINSYSGFQVAIEVNDTQLADGTTVYTPVITPGDDLNMLIGVRETRSFLDQITNGRLSTAVKAARYFSNEKVFDAKLSPSLSSPLQTTMAGYTYEQGELASFGAGDIRAYYYYDVGNPLNKDQWLKITGDGFSGEQDRLVVSPRFFYTFLAADKVSNAVFQLLDSNGQPVDTRQVSNPTPLSMVLLDYSALLTRPPVVVTLPLAKLGPVLLYTLHVTGDNGYDRQTPLIFYQQNPSKPARSLWGWIQIQTMVSNPDYNLLDTNGRLITQTQPDGTQTQHRVFEIRLKSRFTFWRYQNDEGNTLKTTPDLQIFLDLVGSELVTREPRFLTYRPSFFHNTNDNTYHFLPNPDSAALTEIDARQAFSNILVPESNLFPIA
jgi:hypothetical protein